MNPMNKPQVDKSTDESASVSRETIAWHGATVPVVPSLPDDHSGASIGFVIGSYSIFDIFHVEDKLVAVKS